MDLEKLTKHQIILLTLLVSFVTSIATGIVTVSLMNQAPPSVTRTINQIVEHTVQTVAPTTPSVAAVTAQKTIVIKDDDLTANTIQSVQKSIIRITVRGSEDLLARGIIIDSKGTALTDRATLENSGSADFDAILANGMRVPVLLSAAKATSTAFLSITLVSTTTTFTSAPIADSSKIRLGQSIIRISGSGSDSVGEGVIATIPQTTDTVQATTEATIPGSIIMTLFGEVLGMTTAQSLVQSSGSYTLIKPKAETKTLLKT